MPKQTDLMRYRGEVTDFGTARLDILARGGTENDALAAFADGQQWWAELSQRTGCEWKTVGGANLCIGKGGEIHNDGPNKGKTVGDFVKEKGRQRDQKEAEKTRDSSLPAKLAAAFHGAAKAARIISNPVGELIGMAVQNGYRASQGKFHDEMDSLERKYGRTQAHMIMGGRDLAAAGMNLALHAVGGPIAAALGGWLGRTSIGRMFLETPARAAMHGINALTGTRATTEEWRNANSASRAQHDIQRGLLSQGHPDSGGGHAADPGRHPANGEVVTKPSGFNVNPRTGNASVSGEVNGVQTRFMLDAANTKKLKELVAAHGKGSNEVKTFTDRQFHTHAHFHHNPSDAGKSVDVFRHPDGGYVSRPALNRPDPDEKTPAGWKKGVSSWADLSHNAPEADAKKPPGESAPKPAGDSHKKADVQVHGWSAWGGPVVVQGKVNGEHHSVQLSDEDSEVAHRLSNSGDHKALDSHLHRSLHDAAVNKTGKAHAHFVRLDAPPRPAACFNDTADPHPTLTPEERRKIGEKAWSRICSAFLKEALKNKAGWQDALAELKQKEKELLQ